MPGRPRKTEPEETALAVTGFEAQAQVPAVRASAAIATEVQGAILVAQNFPRNEDRSFERLMRSCKRTSFAEDAAYKFPRGGQTISGPSVRLAREAARLWGNIRYGLDIVRDDEDTRQIRGWAWDVETNTKVEAEDDFKKLVYRKKGGWIKPDERDLRELSNRRGAILVRNCILQLLPPDLIEDALNEASETLKDRAAKDPDAERKRLILAFGDLNVTPDDLAGYLGKPIAKVSPSELATLREVYVSIRDGHSNWLDYAGDQPTAKKREGSTSSLTMDKLKPKKEAGDGEGEGPQGQDHKA